MSERIGFSLSSLFSSSPTFTGIKKELDRIDDEIKSNCDKVTKISSKKSPDDKKLRNTTITMIIQNNALMHRKKLLMQKFIRSSLDDVPLFVRKSKLDKLVGDWVPKEDKEVESTEKGEKTVKGLLTIESKIDSKIPSPGEMKRSHIVKSLLESRWSKINSHTDLTETDFFLFNTMNEDKNVKFTDGVVQKMQSFIIADIGSIIGNNTSKEVLEELKSHCEKEILVEHNNNKTKTMYKQLVTKLT